MKSESGIIENSKQAVAYDLAKLLSDELVLYIKTKNAHWNIEGSDFNDKHVFFETQFKQLDEIVDKVAERIRILGHYTNSTFKTVLELTHLTEKRRTKNDSLGLISELLIDHESIIIHCREYIPRFKEEYKDSGSGDFITGIMEIHEKMTWFLRSHLN
jgi:starvation-inducible DNA-binding protein